VVVKNKVAMFQSVDIYYVVVLFVFNDLKWEFGQGYGV
jgi:hypothetical protein